MPEHMSTSARSPVWDKARHQDRRPFLMARNDITASLRRWFGQNGFVEVETAALQVSPGNETHLHAVPALLTGADGGKLERYLHTSPEFAMKKLLAAGETRIVNFARVARDRELTALHALEFTMLEWYRANEPYERAMADAIALLRVAAEAVASGHLTWAGRNVDPYAEPEWLTVAEAFQRYAAIRVITDDGDRDGFAALARAAGIDIAGDDDWSDIFSRIMVERIEPNLGQERITVLHEYPPSEAALARVRPGSPPVAERFEVYVCGIELANGFGELTDAVEQRRRFVAAMDRREAIYGDRYPIDEDFLAALAHMPPASGVALGLDRLVMLAAGAPSVHHVQWSPVDTGSDHF